MMRDEDLLRPVVMGLFSLVQLYPQFLGRLDVLLKMAIAVIESPYSALEEKSMANTVYITTLTKEKGIQLNNCYKGLSDPTKNIDLKAYFLAKLNELFSTYPQVSKPPLVLYHSPIRCQILQQMKPALEPLLQKIQQTNPDSN
jgi:hypothetical protein